MCSSLYKAWAEELEKANDFKRADQVFQIGLQCRAQPVQELEDAHVFVIIHLFLKNYVYF